MNIFKDFMTKTVVPVALIVITVIALKRFYVRDGKCDYVFMWIVVGIPFGITKIKSWYMVLSTNVAKTVASVAFRIAYAGLIGGFVVVGKLTVAFYYMVRTFMRVVFRNNESIKKVYQNT